MLQYCSKCGCTWMNQLERECDAKCPYCKTDGINVPKKYLLFYNNKVYKNNFKDDNAKQTLIEECVKTSPEFDQYLFDHRDEDMEKRRAEYDRRIAIGEALIAGNNKSIQVKCPSCGSTNISKIGTINRAVSTGIFGLASSKIGKTHKCNNCGTTW